MNGEISIQTFVNDSLGEIRTAEINGIIYFVAVDIATILGYTNSRDAVRKHVDEEDKLTVAICDGSSPNPNKTVINESGLYSLILQSKLPRARDFKRWVTSEVLPSLRKTGHYSLPNANDFEPEDSDIPQTAVTARDYLALAKIIASCKTERLPLVIKILEKGGWSIGSSQELVQSGLKDTSDAGARIKNVMTKYDVSVERIAKEIGWCKQTLYTYLNGKRFPYPKNYTKLLNDLNAFEIAHNTNID
ncbi:MAG: hypothetical protein IKP95_13070 [Ruminococcus sp.]|nr:hypothetical protein [Ruminococcus sp.]MBR6103353.1 hypothetical protein [Ruminococcus sp.]